MILHSILAAALAASALLTPIPVCADDVEPAAADEQIEIPQITVRLHVSNSEKEPVVGATVTPVGMRTRVERGSHYGWGEEQHGKLPILMTDKDGMVEAPCPKFVMEKLEVGEVTWMIEHEDYIVFREDRNVDDAPGLVVLERGRRILVGTIDALSEEKITDNLHAILSGGGGGQNEWNMTNGMLMSRGVDKERSILRVFQAPKDGPIKFSDPIDLNEYENKMRVLLRDVKLQPGTRIDGKLDDSVPRPIKNGTVSFMVIDGADRDDRSARNHWMEWTKINDDGTFAVDSMPRGSVVQMIAVCDGFVNTMPSQEDLQAVGLTEQIARLRFTRVCPQVAILKGDAITPVVTMEPTASCRVTVLDPDGKPLAGAMVATNPNQIWLGGGSQIVGDGSSHRAALSLTEEQKKMTWSWAKRQEMSDLGVSSNGGMRYMVTTGDDGVAELQTLPGGSKDEPRSVSISVHHDKYEQPVGGGSGIRRQATVTLIRGETEEITIKMDKKGTKVIGE